jgi:cell division protein FtsB
MLRIKCLSLAALLSLVAFLYVAPTRVSAQTAKPVETAQADRDQTLHQLLKEVHELRLALQHATVSNVRFQILIERLKGQQAEVNALSRQLESVSSQLAKLKAARIVAAAQLKEMDDRLGQASAEERAAIETVVTEGKRASESRAAEEQQQLEMQTDLTTRLQVAQASLNEINSQLDLLMNELKEP